MHLMARKSSTISVNVRALPKAKQALDRIVADLTYSERYNIGAKQLTQDYLVQALWMWAEAQDRDVLALALARHIEAVHAQWPTTEAKNGRRKVEFESESFDEAHPPENHDGGRKKKSS